MNRFEFLFKLRRRLQVCICPVRHFKKMGEELDPRMKAKYEIYWGKSVVETCTTYECEFCRARAVGFISFMMPQQQCEIIQDFVDFKISTDEFLKKAKSADLKVVPPSDTYLSLRKLQTPAK